MSESQIDWVEEFKKSTVTIHRSTLFDEKIGYEDAELLVNALRTPDGTYLESRHQHDYKSYLDTKTGCVYFVDGGLDYARGTYSAEGVEDLRIYDLDDIELIREHFTWGIRGKCNSKPLEYKLLKTMSNEHINAILKTQTHIPTYMFNMFTNEVGYREGNNIVVEDNYG